MLSCEAWFTEEFIMTERLGISDPTCASTIRLIERTGGQVMMYRGWKHLLRPRSRATRRVRGERRTASR